MFDKQVSKTIAGNIRNIRTLIYIPKTCYMLKFSIFLVIFLNLSLDYYLNQLNRNICLLYIINPRFSNIFGLGLA